MRSFKSFFTEATSPTITDEEFKNLYDVLNRWSSDIELVNKQEMSFVRQYQHVFEYTGLMHRVLWLTPHKELNQTEIDQIKTKEEVLKYERIHSEHSWSKSLAKVKDFAVGFLEDDFDFSEFRDPNIQQLITVFCKQTGSGFDIEKFYKAYNKRFKITTPQLTEAIYSSAEIKEVIAPIDDATFEAKPAMLVFGVQGVINRSGKPVEGGKGSDYVEPHLRPKIYNAGGFGKGQQVWVDVETGKRFKGKHNMDTVEYLVAYNGRWLGGEININPKYYDFKDFKYQPGDPIIK